MECIPYDKHCVQTWIGKILEARLCVLVSLIVSSNNSKHIDEVLEMETWFLFGTNREGCSEWPEQF